MEKDRKMTVLLSFAFVTVMASLLYVAYKKDLIPALSNEEEADYEMETGSDPERDKFLNQFNQAAKTVTGNKNADSPGSRYNISDESGLFL